MKSNEIDTDFVAEMNTPMGHSRTLGPAILKRRGRGAQYDAPLEDDLGSLLERLLGMSGSTHGAELVPGQGSVTDHRSLTVRRRPCCARVVADSARARSRSTTGTVDGSPSLHVTLPYG